MFLLKDLLELEGNYALEGQHFHLGKDAFPGEEIAEVTATVAQSSGKGFFDARLAARSWRFKNGVEGVTGCPRFREEGHVQGGELESVADSEANQVGVGGVLVR